MWLTMICTCGLNILVVRQIYPHSHTTQLKILIPKPERLKPIERENSNAPMAPIHPSHTLTSKPHQWPETGKCKTVTPTIPFTCVEEMKYLSQRLLKHQKSMLRIANQLKTNWEKQWKEFLTEKRREAYLLEEKKWLTIPKLRERTCSFFLILIHFTLISRATASTTKYKPISFYKYCRTYSSKSSESLSPKLQLYLAFVASVEISPERRKGAVGSDNRGGKNHCEG